MEDAVAMVRMLIDNPRIQEFPNHLWRGKTHPHLAVKEQPPPLRQTGTPPPLLHHGHGASASGAPPPLRGASSAGGPPYVQGVNPYPALGDRRGAHRREQGG